MKNVLSKVLVVFTLCLFFNPVFAQDSGLENARKNISKQFGGLNPENITRSPVAGLYQVSMPPRFFYASEDGRYIVDGDLIDMQMKQNISNGLRNQSIAVAINAMGEDSMIIFGDAKLKHTVTVFTDIDCGYCRKLHNEVKKYNKLGIRVRYMAYPRAGIGSPSFKKADDVWCSEDRAAALTKAKNGLKVNSKQCKNPVAQHYALGNMIGIKGTPAIVLEDGTIIPGYIPASRLAEALSKAKK